MSDVSGGPGWWQASDGKWYRPEQHPDYRPPPPPVPAPPPKQQTPVAEALFVTPSLPATSRPSTAQTFTESGSTSTIQATPISPAPTASQMPIGAPPPTTSQPPRPQSAPAERRRRSLVRDPRFLAGLVAVIVVIAIVGVLASGGKEKPSSSHVGTTVIPTRPSATVIPTGPSAIVIPTGPSATTSAGVTTPTTTPAPVAAPAPSTSPAPPTASAGCTNLDPVDHNPVPCNDMGGEIVQGYTVGQTGTLYDSADQVPLVTVTVSAPTFTTSDSSGDTPQYGYFATFTVTETDIAPQATQDDTMPDPGYFYIQESNGSDYGNGGEPNGVLSGNGFDVNNGNTLGSNTVGGSIDLYPGQSTTGTVTIDCPSQHGRLYDDDGGQIDGYWTF